ncbi:Mediator of RNA polymerase II transcription subunit 16 [Sporothrix curviconia]|uniref:Mediator of RNA polymerase II transcription subunit 16 n=1 Tax=Sporothrix curviconia TaxID=1260050 RepID=A0ABP0CN31_9PEZI
MTDDIPLILDDAMSGIPGMSGDVQVSLGDVDVDDVDLFGGPVELSLPSHPPPSKQLQICVNEQRIRGCNQRIAWSKQGTLATIGADGQSVDLRYLQTDPETASWGLSEALSHTQFSPMNTHTTFSGGPIVHIAWAAAGHPELAVIDSVGRYNIIHGPAVLEEKGYKYETTFIHASAPYHPNPTKSALLCVTVSGTLRLLFSQSNNMVHDTSMELENITSSDDLATHASICSEKNNLLVAMVTASRQLKVVRAAIGWIPAQSEKQTPHQGQQLNPQLQQKPAAVTTWLQRNDEESQVDISSSQISHIEMLPSAVHPGTNQWIPPLVVSIREYLPTPSTASFTPEPQSIINRWELLVESPQQPLHPAFEQLGFTPSQVSNQQGNQGATRLHRLPTITLNRLVVSVQTIQQGRVICLFFSDGTQQYRDRFTFDEIYNDSNPARISALQHAGFQFVDPTPCLSAALSPTGCSFAQVCEDGKVKWNSLKYVGEDIATSGPDPNYAAVVAALTTAVSTASINQISYDDILATARQFIHRPRFAYEWMTEMIRILKINVDYSEEAHHDQLVRNNTLHICLSILNHLGFHGEFKPRSFYGKFSMLALNMRNIVILITIASNTPGNLKDKINPLDEPDVVDALAGCAKWALDLLAYTCDCIFSLLDDAKFMSFLKGDNFNELVPYLQEKNEVALHLILCSSTRGFLSAACRRLLHLDTMSSRAIQYNELQQQQSGSNGHSALRSALFTSYHKMQRYTSSSLIRVQELDKLLWALGEEIRQTYQSKTGGAAAAAAKKQGQGQGQGQGQAPTPTVDPEAKRFQARCEQALLLANNMPPSFQPLLYKFFDENLRNFRTLNDPAKLYFADYSILEVEDDARSLREKRARHTHIDVFKRVELKLASNSSSNGTAIPPPGHPLPLHPSPSEYLRRCVRCTSIMEDITGTRPGYTFVLAQQRKCSCSGNWGFLPRSTFVG